MPRYRITWGIRKARGKGYRAQGSDTIAAESEPDAIRALSQRLFKQGMFDYPGEMETIEVAQTDGSSDSPDMTSAEGGLLDHLQHADKGVRLNALEVLRETFKSIRPSLPGFTRDECLTLLVNALNDPETEVRQIAAQVLSLAGQHRTDPPSEMEKILVASALLKAAQSPGEDLTVRRSIIHALRYYPEPDAIPVLAALVSHKTLGEIAVIALSDAHRAGLDIAAAKNAIAAYLTARIDEPRWTAGARHHFADLVQVLDDLDENLAYDIRWKLKQRKPKTPGRRIEDVDSSE